MTPHHPTPTWVPRSDWLAPPAARPDGIDVRYVLVLTLVGALLRLLMLTRQSVWVDEILTWNAVRPGAGLSFLEQFLDTIQGPLYLAVIWPLLHLQDDVLMLRLPAAVAGILAVPLFGLLAGRVLPSRAARLALLMFALNPFHVWYSQEGRGYAFAMLLAVVTALCYLALVRRGPGTGPVVGFGLAGAGMVLSNMSGVFLLAAMGTSLVLLDRPASRRAWGGWVFAFGLAVALCLPWLLQAAGIWAVDRIVPGVAMGEALRGDSTFSPLAIPYAFFTFFFGYSLGPSLRELHAPDRAAVLLGYWPVILAVGTAAGTALLAGVLRPDRRRVALMIWSVVPVALLALLALRNVKPWNARYVAVVLPWLVLLAASGLARLPRRGELAVAAVLAGLTVWSLGGYYVADKYVKADVRAAVAHVDAAVPSVTTVLVPTVTGVFKYYDRGAHELLDSFGRAPLGGREDADAYVTDVLRGRDHCRVVLARSWYFDPYEQLLPALARAGRLHLEAELPGVRVFTWQRREKRTGDHEP